MDYDIIVIGAGPAGLSFARSFKDSSLRLLVIERAPLEAIQNPTPDGREIALTHLSIRLMKALGAWQHIPAEHVSPIQEAKVMNGTSSYFLDFDSRDVEGAALGYLVPNFLIRKSLYTEAQPLENVEIMTDTAVEQIKTDAEVGSVTLADGRTISARLIVAADSRFSASRRAMGISASMQDFAKTAIVCRMEHEQPHNQIAWECFHYERTLAVLPMAGNLSSIVITVHNELADQILAMTEEEFNKDIQERFENRLGSMKLLGKRHSYPLMAVHADKFIANRYAVIGDAAVGMHPVTAHGFNLGLRGQATLVKEILRADKRGGDIGARRVLIKYDMKHQRITRPMYWGTNGIVALFTNELPPVKAVRNLVLRVANNLPPVKRMIKNRLTEIST
ncbi:MAG: 5-demethoxyubiquinol-8 5-hydroxylase UbiM [Gammaproteobacteria bacterium]|nr:5-demethoxyubiquinol-8 5-hydroxylase UbiM [Gammaproteobacteria bacterium]